MPQAIVLLKELASPDQLHRHQESGLLRVSVTFLPGSCYAAMGIAADPDAATAIRNASSAASLDGTSPTSCVPPECIPGELVPGPLPKVSWVPPAEHMAFAVLTVLNGRRSAWAEAVNGIAERVRESVYVAGGDIVGCTSLNTMVEVVSDDYERFHEALRQVTDLEGVVDVRVLRAVADDTRGMGSTVEGA